MTIYDRCLVWLVRWALREMGNAAAWQFYCILREAYRQRPDLAGED